MRLYGGALYGSASHILRSLEHISESKELYGGALYGSATHVSPQSAVVVSPETFARWTIFVCVCYNASVALGQQKKYIVYVQE